MRTRNKGEQTEDQSEMWSPIIYCNLIQILPGKNENAVSG